MLRAYEIEVCFYDAVAGAGRDPDSRGHLGWHDPDTGWFVLLLEDVTGAVQGEQLDGCGPEVAAAALGEMAGLHGPVWESPELGALAWLNRSSPESNALMAAVVAPLFPGFVERYGDRIETSHLALCERFVARAGGMARLPRRAPHGHPRRLPSATTCCSAPATPAVGGRLADGLLGNGGVRRRLFRGREPHRGRSAPRPRA